MPDRPTPESILQRALDIEGSGERVAYLDKICADDPALCDEIESLMAAQFAADAFMDLLTEPVSENEEKFSQLRLDDGPVRAGFASVSRRMKKFVRRNRRGLLIGALLAVLAVAAVIWLDSSHDMREHVKKLEEQTEWLMERNPAMKHELTPMRCARWSPSRESDWKEARPALGASPTADSGPSRQWQIPGMPWCNMRLPNRRRFPRNPAMGNRMKVGVGEIHRTEPAHSNQSSLNP